MLSLVHDDAEHQTHAANAMDAVLAERKDAVLQIFALLLDLMQELRVAHMIEHCIRGRTDERRAAEGRRMRARRQNVAAGICREHSADRNAAAETLRHGDNIRTDAVLLERKQAAGAADAGLYLVDDEQHILLAAERLDLLDEFLIERQHAALALYKLHHDCASHIVGLAANIVDVVRDRIVKALGEREEIVMETILAGRLERSYGAAVEGIDERYDLVASLAVLVERILARELDRTLVGLRTRVGEEYLAVQMGLFDELLRDLHHRFRGKQVGCVHDLVRLLGDRVDKDLVVVAHAVDADAGGKVDVLLALYVPQGRTLAVVERDREAAVGVHYIFIFFVFQFVICHWFSPFSWKICEISINLLIAVNY